MLLAAELEIIRLWVNNKLIKINEHIICIKVLCKGSIVLFSPSLPVEIILEILIYKYMVTFCQSVRMSRYF